MKTSIFITTIMALSIIGFSNCKNSGTSTTTKEVVDLNDSDALLEALKENYIQYGNGSVQIALFNGPYQTNGASPWFSMIPVGTPGQVLKFGMDTGNNGIWLTSTLCQTAACTQPGRVQFDYTASSTFGWIDQTVDTLNFGPWGKMAVENGMDFFGNNMPLGQETAMLLAQNYDGVKFEEVDWDGGIGFPSQNPDPRTSWLVEQMVNAGLVDPNNVILTFYMTDTPYGKMGYLNIGALPQQLVDPASKLVMPYLPYKGLEYLWSTEFDRWTIDGNVMPSDSFFVFDTGSSDFKGDTIATDRTTAAIQNYYDEYGTFPNMDLYMGQDINGAPGHLTLNGSQYMKYVEKGQRQGQTVIAIDTLNISEMILVGSVLLDHVVSSYVYNVSGSAGNYSLSPRETWLFNKANGPKVIQ